MRPTEDERSSQVENKDPFFDATKQRIDGTVFKIKELYSRLAVSAPTKEVIQIENEWVQEKEFAEQKIKAAQNYLNSINKAYESRLNSFKSSYSSNLSEEERNETIALIASEISKLQALEGALSSFGYSESDYSPVADSLRREMLSSSSRKDAATQKDGKVVRRPGRPKGSANKTTGRRGRPKGSRNKPKVESVDSVQKDIKDLIVKVFSDSNNQSLKTMEIADRVGEISGEDYKARDLVKTLNEMLESGKIVRDKDTRTYHLT